jgi:hypothetical protein
MALQALKKPWGNIQKDVKKKWFMKNMIFK